MADLPTPSGGVGRPRQKDAIALAGALATSAFQSVRYGIDGVWAPGAKANARRRSFNASQFGAHL